MTAEVEGATPAARPRVVVISHELPNDNPGHAGGVYVQHVCRLAAANAHVTVIAPHTPSNRVARETKGSPESVLLPRYPGLGSRGARLFDSLLMRVYRKLAAVCIGLPAFSISRALVGRTVERRAVAEADIIDLQYSESIRLAALIRRLNPTARLVGTFHDVQSQVIARNPARFGHGWLKWRINGWQLRRAERNATRRLDDVVVFSMKDAALLPGPCRVIKPPLALPRPMSDRSRTDRPIVLMVGVLRRPENDEGATWLVDQVWPDVLRQVPDALLRIVGSGASDSLTAAAEAHASVTLVGFVEDLEDEYAIAAAVAVPLHRGAGVKFKTIEALVRTVPVVTTPVGAEGIGDSSRFAGFTDDPIVFAQALVDVLLRRSAAEDFAAATSSWAIKEFGFEQFRRETEASYAMRNWTSPGDASDAR